MRDVKVKYLAGGEWKSKIIDRLGKHRHESTKLARTYTAFPPEGGWPGGDPLKNGYKPQGGK